MKEAENQNMSFLFVYKYIFRKTTFTVVLYYMHLNNHLDIGFPGLLSLRKYVQVFLNNIRENS